jgi:hypothetical protein
MKPGKETIKSFQEIYFEEFGEQISADVAYEKFLRLVNFLRAFSNLSSRHNPLDEVDLKHESDKIERLQ